MDSNFEDGRLDTARLDELPSLGIAEVVRGMRGGEVLGSHLDDAVPVLVRQRYLEGVVNYQCG